ncbi:hypothetical protein HNR44_002377 [Geomicrobium halophilum]|uniref:SLH domain-containing protein n=1 Tax=Geomicrobium halophilum TaxID=549000 RepID=A0A841PRF5_9BACL|nr:S-layer homology domain-containing protein [Geomicrobium halophilum]MBB6450394.1 hypothetical protein [Geomicrobium halophilum]
MKLRKHRWPLLSIPLLFTFFVTACSELDADADEQAEAASDDWVESELESMDSNLKDVEGRVDTLADEVELLSEGRTFYDVQSHYHAFDEIEFLYERGTINGYRDGNFRPGNEISRGQTAAMIDRELNLSIPDNYELQVTDVSSSNEYYDELRAMEYHGIMNGHKGEMQPNAPLKRSQMARVLVRAMPEKIPEASSHHLFTDMNENTSGYVEVNRIADANITTTIESAFRPNEATSRAQFALFMARTTEESFR